MARATIALASAWSFLGPLPLGKTEFDADVAAASPAGVRGLLALGASARVRSELVAGGVVRGWAPLETNAEGVVTVAPAADWQGLVNGLGDTAVLEFGGWAAGTLTLEGFSPVPDMYVRSQELEAAIKARLPRHSV